MDKVAGDVRQMVNDYRAIKLLSNNADYKVYMTYLNYAPEIQAMI